MTHLLNKSMPPPVLCDLDDAVADGGNSTTGAGGSRPAAAPGGSNIGSMPPRSGERRPPKLSMLAMLMVLANEVELEDFVESLCCVCVVCVCVCVCVCVLRVCVCVCV
jgi:hypothetical protein